MLHHGCKEVARGVQVLASGLNEKRPPSSQKAIVFECKFVPCLQIPIPMPNLRIESSNVSDQGFKLTSIFARVRLKQFLRASPIIPVHAKSAPALLCPQASSQQEDWQGQIVAEFLQKFIAPVRRPVLAEDSVGPRPACDNGGHHDQHNKQKTAFALCESHASEDHPDA